jgi:hypothetical protein
VVLAVIAAGCAGDDDDTASSVPLVDLAPALDWSDLPDAPVVYAGWGFGSCGGTAPLLCVTGPAGDGTVELLRYGLEGYPDIEADLDDGAPAAEALRGFAAAYVSSNSSSVPVDCPGTSVVAGPTEPARVGGHDGLRYGFDVLDEDGVTVERYVQWVAVDGGDLVVVAAGAIDPDRGCFEPIGEFTPATLAAVLPVLGDVIAASELRS